MERKNVPGTTTRAELTFKAVPVSSLCIGTITSFDIYVRTNEGRPPVLYRKDNLPISRNVLSKLRQSGHERLYIPSIHDADYRRYIETNLDALLKDESVPSNEKSEILYHSAQGLMSDLLADPERGDLVTRSKNMAANAESFLRGERTAFSHLLQIVSYDYYTYTHSVNVFVFSIALGQRVGLPESSMLDFGTGLLLHDIGKSRIDPSITNCTGKLNADQWLIMKQHTLFGHDILTKHAGISDLAMDVVLHHHEKLNGLGYPHGLKGDEISPHVRTSTIADIFDALTTRRSYKDAVPTFSALSMMRDLMSNEIDHDLFRDFVQLMGNS